MRLYEFSSKIKTYIARVKLKNGSTVTATERTESLSYARQIFNHKYGENNVSSVSHLYLDEQKTIKATPSQLKHEKIVNYLTNKITRIKNRPKVTQQDVRKAVERYKTRQKRANLELQKQQEIAQARNH